MTGVVDDGQLVCLWCSRPVLVDERIWETTSRGIVHVACEERAAQVGRLMPPVMDRGETQLVNCPHCSWSDSIVKSVEMDGKHGTRSAEQILKDLFSHIRSQHPGALSPEPNPGERMVKARFVMPMDGERQPLPPFLEEGVWALKCYYAFFCVRHRHRWANQDGSCPFCDAEHDERSRLS